MTVICERFFDIMITSITCVVGSRGLLDTQSHWVSALSWPTHKSMVGGCLGMTSDTLLVGCIDGSVAALEILGGTSFKKNELDYCKRENGMIVF